MLKTFKLGGVHPQENKLSSKCGIEKVPLPERVSIPVSQHIGVPSVIVVKKGDRVKVGTVIAKHSGFVSANIHSSVSGTVQSIDEISGTTGYRQTAITISVEGDDWEETIDQSTELKKDITSSATEIINTISESGIVGMGGATFPTHVKLTIPPGKKAELLIVNAVECEPYLTADHSLMLEKPNEIMVGISILKKALNISKAVIAIENNKPDAIKKLHETSKSYNAIEVAGLKVKYPQGSEKQLIKAITNREVPRGKLPIEVGVVVVNVGTANAVYEAVQKHKPLIDRVVTVTGKSIKNPSNLQVRIGTSIDHLINHVGGLPDDTTKIINGGPMMGKAIRDTTIPITKGTSGIVLMSKSEGYRKEEKNCIRCARCVSACPMGLEPYLLISFGEKQMWKEAEKNRVTDCIECGSCSYICPANRPLLDYVRLGKSTVGRIIRERK